MAKINLRSADEDSSPGYEDYRPYDAGDGSTPGYEGVIIIRVDDKGRRLCMCGCGLEAIDKRNFRQGHDARFKGILQRAHLRGDEITVVDGGLSVTGAAENEAKALGWERFIESAEKRFANQQTKAKSNGTKTTKTKKDATVKAKVGRWVYEGIVVGGEFHYADKQGATKVAQKFTVQ